MLRFWLRLSPLVLLCAAFILILTSTTSRLWRAGSVLEYQRFWPSDDVIWANYADVGRSLNISLEHFLIVTPLQATDTAQDGRLVRSLPTPGNIDLFLTQSDGDENQLTRFGNFPPDRYGADARRSNLFPRWSADQNWIAFLSADGSGKTDVYVVRPDGSDLHLIGDRIVKQFPVRPRWVDLNSTETLPLWALLAVSSVLVLGGAAFYLWHTP